MRSVLISFLAILGTFLLVAAVKRGLTRSERHERTGGRLYYGTLVLVFGLILSVVTAGLVYLISLSNNKEHIAPLLLMATIFGFFAVACFAEMIWSHGFFDQDGITFQSIWKGRRSYRWSQLDRIEANPGMDHHAFVFEDGKKIYVSRSMKGYRELLTLARSKGYLF